MVHNGALNKRKNAEFGNGGPGPARMKLEDHPNDWYVVNKHGDHKSPKDRVVPLPNGRTSWLIYRGDPSHLLIRMILQVVLFYPDWATTDKHLILFYCDRSSRLCVYAMYCVYIHI